MTNYISILEAAEKTGRSQSTITRVARQYRGTKHVKKDGKRYLVSEEIITQLFSNYSNDYSETNQMTSLIKAKNETINLLKNQLEKKDLIIGNLIERNREANIIIKSLQEQIRLPEKSKSKDGNGIIQDIKPDMEKKKPKPKSNTPLIMDLYNKGMSYKEIAEQLNKQGKTNQYGKQYNVNAIKTTVNRNK